MHFRNITPAKMAVFWVVAPCSLVEVYNPEDSHLHTHRCENLKYYITPAVDWELLYSLE
jgi:hypothetical protein